MTDIPVEPITFINEILILMKKHAEIDQMLEISYGAKKVFGANIAKWMNVTEGMTNEQRDEAVKLTKMFIIGYYCGSRGL